MNSRPRILILSTAYLPLIGGSELAIVHTTGRLTEFDFDMVTGRYTQEMPLVEQVGRVRVFRAGGRLARMALIVPKALMPFAIAVTAARLMRRQRYALIHVYQASQAGGAAWLLKLFFPKVPVILTLQEGKELDAQGAPLRFFRGAIIRSADHVTAISNHLAAYARRYTRAPITLIPNGVDTGALAAPTGRPPAGPEKIIVSVSRLVPKNGVANIIRALPLVNAQIPVRLVLVGDGPLRQELSDIATDEQVSGKIDFVGSVPHERMAEHLHRADVFVRPSLSEGLGTAFLEAMAAGVPVVASRVGGIGDFLEHGKTGLVCDPHSPADIALQTIRLLTDEVLRKHVTEQALAMVHAKYDWDVIAAAMARVYGNYIHG